MTNDDDKDKKQNNKLKKMMTDLKKTPPYNPPSEDSIFDVIRKSQPKKRKKYSADIIQLRPNGDLDFTQSDLYHDVTYEAYDAGYSQAVDDLKEELDVAKNEAKRLRNLLDSILSIANNIEV